MEQQKALNALEPFLALSKSATSPRAAADLVTQATSAPNTSIFAELLQTPNIQALRTSEHAASLQLLEIFAWGTYADYTAAASTLPPLSEAQLHKLRLLSLLTLLAPPTQPASPTGQNISYAYLQSALGLPDTRALEALLSTALSAALIAGHLDPRHSLIAVTSVAPLRDLPPASVPALAATLTNWEGRCDGMLAELDSRVEAIRSNAAKRGVREERRRKAFDAEVEKEGGKGGGKRSAPSGDNGGPMDDEMDVDEGLGLGGALGRGARGVKKMFSSKG